MAKIIDGKTIAQTIRSEVAEKVKQRIISEVQIWMEHY